MNIKYLILIILTIFCIHAKGQNIESFKTNLETYENNCILLQERIKYIKNHYKELDEKAMPRTRVMTLIKKISKEIDNRNNDNLYNIFVELEDSLKTVHPTTNTTPTTEVNSPVQNPSTKIDDNSMGNRNDGRFREEDHRIQEHSSSSVVDDSRELDDFLSQYNTLTDMYQHKDKILENLEKYEGNPKRLAYINIIQLFGIQYEIYRRDYIKDLLAKVSSGMNDVLEQHKHELEEEILNVSDYRYATKELLRLFKIIDNPTFMKKDATNSKFEDENTVSVEKLEEYFENNKNETEYVDRFDFTKRQFDAYLKADSSKRTEMKSKIEGALELK